MHFGIPQIIFTAWLCMSIGIYLTKHGEPREGNYNFFTALVSAVLQVFLLYKGGFYG